MEEKEFHEAREDIECLMEDYEIAAAETMQIEEE
eukprot:CAMPEP_0202943830 /NCGR_PEP_ID=MMETSP1395-20130829/4412_1 /ASSEMBLY_ACC=CAM_ASM_000871 /TAXON_ID=5961 /ORGANISM="Blepharisma japonicum, Strain Stock R1072" /LENGTH=33 /DNA_ID= /DNA_START= /DNA_END= /DNA_ORIENTATION=